MPTNVFLQSVGGRCGTREDRFIPQIAANVGDKLFHGPVAPLRLFAHGHLQDVVFVPAKFPVQAGRFERFLFANPAD
jgi:hypothetical protein